MALNPFELMKNLQDLQAKMGGMQEKLKTVHLRTYTTTVMIFFMRTIIPTIRSMRVWYIRFSVIPWGTGLPPC